MSTFPSASYDDWKLMSPEEEHERLYGPWDEDDVCHTCGGEGCVELDDHPELWDDDCPPMNDLVPCPDCAHRSDPQLPGRDA